MTESAEKRETRASILDGNRVAAEIRREVAAEVESLAREHSVTPCLAVVRVGDDPASEVYVRNKVKTSRELGLLSEHHTLTADVAAGELLDTVQTLNAREDVDGVLVQLPLPKGIDERLITDSVDPAKDVDGFHPLNIGRTILGEPSLVPCTPAGIYELLVREGVALRGAHAVVVGRSHIVGRPMAQLLLRADATVTICHSRTPDLAEHTRRADILVCAVGIPGLVRGEHVKPGAVVVDVGMNRVTDEAEARALFGERGDERVEAIRRRGYTLVGDVHPAEVGRVAGRLTPVPGGVGPLTVAMLMRNTVTAARRRRGLGAAKI
ncbi:MAG: bifunctional 5,10-methylenetetrahydrofolate dehydrogenase/5,10-methenyltetrahydrofolate cyclohydrolase [Pyrinomonadaceae bacterium]